MGYKLHRQQEVEKKGEEKKDNEPDRGGKVGALSSREEHACKEIEKDPDIGAFDMELSIKKAEAHRDQRAKEIGELNFEDNKRNVQLIRWGRDKIEKKQNPEDVKRLYT